MSSALLYVAIVVIWAIFLIPPWIRRSRPATLSAPQAPPGPGPAATAQAGLARARPSSAARDLADDGVVVPERPRPRLPRQERPGPERAGPERAGPERPGPQRSGQGPDTAGHFPAGGQAFASMPPVGRARILRARRRMLTVLVALVIAMAGCYAAKLTPWWVCAPPAGMLGLYLLLLREAGRADAEQARWRAEEAALRAHAAHAAHAARATEQRPAAAPEPAAEVIDISGRVSDLPYDQYADVAARAVGD